MKLKRKANPNSLANLKKGSQALNLDKVRTTVTLFPQTLEAIARLKNRSKAIDMAVLLIQRDPELMEEWQRMVEADYF